MEEVQNAHPHNNYLDQQQQQHFEENQQNQNNGGNDFSQGDFVQMDDH